MAMPPNITQLHVSVLGIGDLQVVRNLLTSYTIWVGFYNGGGTRSRLTIFGFMVLPPNIIQLHVSVLGIGHFQVVHNLLTGYTIFVGYHSGGEEASSYNIGRFGQASQFYTTICFGPT